jgi:hypothetical protein
VNYDGINVYGDEVTTNKGVAAGLLVQALSVSHNLLLLIVCLIIM